MKLFKKDVKQIISGHIRCDGTINALIELNNGLEIELYSLTIKQADSLESMDWTSLDIDERLTRQTEHQWLTQNGIQG